MKLTDYFYTAGEVATRLKVGRSTIWRWIQEGRFNAEQFSSLTLIPKWEIDLLQKKGERWKPANQ